MAKQTLRTCPNGHQYYKSSDCPTCPLCEQGNKPTTGFLSLLSAPARRALENNGIRTLSQLAEYSEHGLLKLHGIGPASIPQLKDALKEAGLSFQKNKG